MVDITAIAPVKATVEINGQKIDVPGLSLEGYAHIALHHPAVLGMMRPDSPQMSMAEFIIAAGNKAICALIAAGCGKPGDEQAEAVAASFGMQDQIDLLCAIAKRTMPRGMIPFAEAFNDLIKTMTGPEAAIRERVKSWSSQSNASLPKDTRPTSSGGLPSVNSQPILPSETSASVG